MSMWAAFHRWRCSEPWGWTGINWSNQKRNPSKCICWWWSSCFYYSCGQLNLSTFVPNRAVGMSMAHNPIGNDTGAKNAAIGGHMNRTLNVLWRLLWDLNENVMKNHTFTSWGQSCRLALWDYKRGCLKSTYANRSHPTDHKSRHLLAYQC